MFCSLWLASAAQAVLLTPPGGGSSWPTNAPLDSWSFNDTTNWTSDLGYFPLSFSNIASAYFGDGTSLILNTNVPAWLQYNAVETNGATNLSISYGTLSLWFAPGWAGTNLGGTGPGVWGRLIDVGGYSTNGLPGWWSLYIDPDGVNLYFSVQPGDGSTTNYLSSPISWETNIWHFIALTYSATNTALYLDGYLAATNGGLVAWPGTNILAGGMFVGSDSNGVNQAQGTFDDIYTYDVPLSSNAVSGMFSYLYAQYYLSPWNVRPDFASAPSTPSPSSPAPDFITGPGYLHWITNAAGCVTNSNFWFTNFSAVTIGSATTFTFTIAGGSNGSPYDVFATGLLASPMTNAQWAWMGQGYSCNTYSLTLSNAAAAYFVLGSSKDSDGDGLTAFNYPHLLSPIRSRGGYR